MKVRFYLRLSWVVSSARIERQPSKLEVKGSNPLRPASKLTFELILSFLGQHYCYDYFDLYDHLHTVKIAGDIQTVA